MHPNVRTAVHVVIAIVLAEFAGVIGSLFTAPAIPTWYAALEKPRLTPPSWVFAPVWTVLFAIMGVASFLVWRKRRDRTDVRRALGVYAFQLACNVLWSIIFFGLRSPHGALLVIAVLWIAIVATMIAFFRISKIAGWLLVPYLVWVSFAGYLNYSFWRANGGTVACTQEARQCPDGSYVSRIGPRCDFAACPTEISDHWSTTTDRATGISFRYPASLGTAYVHPVDWPPRVQAQAVAFACTETSAMWDGRGQTVQRTIGDRAYCVTTVSEGAAGSTYTTYTYAFPSTGRTIAFVVTLQEVQCRNYDEPNASLCEHEQSSFDLDSVIDRMAQSARR